MTLLVLYLILHSSFLSIQIYYNFFIFTTDALIAAIKADIDYAETHLDMPELSQLQKHSFFNEEKSVEHVAIGNGSGSPHISNL
jgi:hypothetical protein